MVHNAFQSSQKQIRVIFAKHGCLDDQQTPVFGCQRDKDMDNIFKVPIRMNSAVEGRLN